MPYQREWAVYGWALLVVLAGTIVLAPVGCLAYAYYEMSKPIGVVGPDRWPIALAENYKEWQQGGANIERIEVFATKEDIVNDKAILKVPDKPETWKYFETWSSERSRGTLEASRERWETVSDRYPGWAPDLDDPEVEILPHAGESDATTLGVARDPVSKTIYIDYFFDF